MATRHCCLHQGSLSPPPGSKPDKLFSLDYHLASSATEEAADFFISVRRGARFSKAQGHTAQFGEKVPPLSSHHFELGAHVSSMQAARTWDPHIDP